MGEDISRDELKQLIKDGVSQGMNNCTVNCPIGEEAPNVRHFMGMVKDIGGGETVEKGIETVRLNHMFTNNLRATVSGTAKKIYYLIIGAIMLALGTAFVAGLKHILGK